MKTILFYSNVKSIKYFSLQKFYKIDIEILKSMGYTVKLTRSILPFFKFYKYDIAFLYFFRYSFFAGLISRFFNKKVYFTGGIDDLDKDYASLKKYNIQKLFFKLCYVISDKIFIVSKADLNNVALIQPNFMNKCVLNQHSIDVNNFLLNDFEVKKNIISTICWMVTDENVKRKGIIESIEVYNSNPYLKNNFKYYILGSFGQGTDKIKKYLDLNNLNNNVFLLGELTEDDKIKQLKESKFYFQLSKYEGFGIAALEAFASGCQVIHSGKGNLKYLFEGYCVNINEIDLETLNFEKSLTTFESNYLREIKDLLIKNYSLRSRKTKFENIL